MIGSTRSVRVFAYTLPTDMRKGFDGLYGMVSSHLEREPLSGEMYLFVARNRKRAKVLMWDGTGLCLYAKRLERGKFAKLWAGAEAQLRNCGPGTHPSVRSLRHRIDRVMRDAEVLGKPDLILRAGREVRQTVELEARLTGEAKEAEKGTGTITVVVVKQFNESGEPEAEPKVIEVVTDG